eukprot:864576-Rhodomonas_salina.1
MTIATTLTPRRSCRRRRRRWRKRSERCGDAASPCARWSSSGSSLQALKGHPPRPPCPRSCRRRTCFPSTPPPRQRRLFRTKGHICSGGSRSWSSARAQTRDNEPLLSTAATSGRARAERSDGVKEEVEEEERLG